MFNISEEASILFVGGIVALIMGTVASVGRYRVVFGKNSKIYEGVIKSYRGGYGFVFFIEININGEIIEKKLSTTSGRLKKEIGKSILVHYNEDHPEFVFEKVETLGDHLFPGIWVVLGVVSILLAIFVF